MRIEFTYHIAEMCRMPDALRALCGHYSAPQKGRFFFWPWVDLGDPDLCPACRERAQRWMGT